MIIFPCLVSLMGGTASVKYHTDLLQETIEKLDANLVDHGVGYPQTFRISFTIPFKRGDADM